MQSSLKKTFTCSRDNTHLHILSRKCKSHTMRYYITSITMAFIEEVETNAGRNVEKKELFSVYVKVIWYKSLGK